MMVWSQCRFACYAMRGQQDRVRGIGRRASSILRRAAGLFNGDQPLFEVDVTTGELRINGLVDVKYTDHDQRQRQSMAADSARMISIPGRGPAVGAHTFRARENDQRLFQWCETVEASSAARIFSSDRSAVSSNSGVPGRPRRKAP